MENGAKSYYCIVYNSGHTSGYASNNYKSLFSAFNQCFQSMLQTIFKNYSSYAVYMNVPNSLFTKLLITSNNFGNWDFMIKNLPTLFWRQNQLITSNIKKVVIHIIVTKNSQLPIHKKQPFQQYIWVNTKSL